MNIDAMLAFMGKYLLGRALTSDEQAIVVDFARSDADDLQTQFACGTALLLASPRFSIVREAVSDQLSAIAKPVLDKYLLTADS